MKNRSTDRWTRLESPEINPRTHCQLVFDKGAKQLNEERESLQQTVLGKPGNRVQESKSGLCLPSFTKGNLKRVKGWNVRAETVKLLEEHGEGAP